MSSSNGAARVVAINQSIAQTGGISAQQATPNTSSPAQVQKAVTTALSPSTGNAVTATNIPGGNPHDAIGYNPAIDPTSTANPSSPNYNQATDTSTPAQNTQPTPTNVNATPSTGATQNLNPQDQAPQSLVNQVQSASDALKAKYTQAHSALNSSGVPSPSSPASGATGVNSALNAQPPAPAPVPKSVSSFMDPTQNPAIPETADQLREFLSPASDRKMLQDSINQLSADRASLAGLKTDLMNTKRIMAGTQQDIRDEVTKAGGFASESQVQALTIARNKTLLQQSQLISDQIQSASDLVASDVSLVGDEKQMAAQQFTQNMSMLNFQQTNYNNQLSAAKDMYETLIDKNPTGLYNSLLADPTQAQRFQQITGLSTDSLKGIVSSTGLDNQYKALQIQKLEQDLGGGGNTNGTITGKPQTASQSAANLYADRLNQADVTLAALGNKFTSKSSFGGILPSFLQSGDRQSYEQAKTNFVTAVLRRESGAAISPTEFKTADTQYFPQAGDQPAVLAQKEALRNTVINNFYKEANVLRPALPGQVIESNGKRYKIGPDGQSLTEI